MVIQRIKSGPLVFVLFLVFSFGTGIVLVTASQQNTEGRSKAAGFAYSTSPRVSPTLSPDACAYVFNGHCYGSANEYMDARAKDWRCKPLFYDYGLCDGPAVERESDEPRTERDQ